MKQLLLALSLLCTSPSVHASQEAPLNDYVGNYPVLAWDGNGKVAATLEVISNQDVSGFRVVPRDVLGGVNAPAKSVFSPTGKTTFHVTNDGVTQSYNDGDDFVEVEYRKKNGTLEIISKDCRDPELTNCNSNEVVSFVSDVPGDVIDARTFFQSIEGTYLVELEGGAVPIDTTYGGVAIDEETGVIGFPYCTPEIGCDPNEIYFPFGETTVTKLAKNNVSTYTIVHKAGDGKVSRYQWEESSAGISLVNYQYLLSGNSVVLEHRFHKSE